MNRPHIRAIIAVTLAVLCLGVAACGDESSPPPSAGNPPSPSPSPSPAPSPPPTDGIPIIGTERLAWDQEAASTQAVMAMTFRLLVDDVASSFTDPRCSTTRTAAGYECSGRLPAMSPGRHVLRVVAIANGVQSSPSAGLAVIVRSPLEPGIVDPGDPSTTMAPIPDAPGVVCPAGPGTDCYRAQLIATGSTPIRRLVPVSSGRLLMIQDDRYLRVIEDGRVLEYSALTLDGQHARLLDVAVPPDFERSRLVFVAWSDQRAGDTAQLHVTRYRELGGVLGEGATIVSGLTLSPGAVAPIALDDQGRLYVAMPAVEDSVLSSRDSAYSRMILRFTADGSVPAANPSSSPVLAYGYARPSAMVWDPVWKRMWLAGEDSRWASPMAVVPSEADARTPWPWLPAAVLQPRDGTRMEVPQLALTLAPSDQARTLWLVAGSGAVQRGAVGQAPQLLQVAPVAFGALGAVTAMAGDVDRGLIVASVPDVGSTGSNIWRLLPLPAVAAPRVR